MTDITKRLYNHILNTGWIGSTMIGDFMDEYPEPWWDRELEFEELVRDEAFLRGFRKWVEVRYQYVLKNLKRDAKSFPLQVYRGMNLPKGFSAEPGAELGVYWSTNPHTEPHWDRGSNGNRVLMRGTVGKQDVDWFRTVLSRMDYLHGDDEEEITIKPNGKIAVDKVQGPVSIPPGVYLGGTPSKNPHEGSTDLTESKYLTVSVPRLEKRVQYWMNPAPQQITEMLKRNPWGYRGIVVDRRLYIWDANELIHYYMTEAMIQDGIIKDEHVIQTQRADYELIFSKTGGISADEGTSRNKTQYGYVLYASQTPHGRSVPSAGIVARYRGNTVEGKLTEGVSDVLYHQTWANKAVQILKQNQIRLTPDLGTDSERNVRKKAKPFYLSTSRSRMGDFHTPVTFSMSSMCILVLDGNKLMQDGFSGQPLDYWGWGNQDEMEDRIYSDKSSIPHATHYIREIHVYQPPKQNDKRAGYTRELYKLSRQASIPIYLYDDPKSMNLLDKRKAKSDPRQMAGELSVPDLVDRGDRHEPNNYPVYSRTEGDFDKWTELLLRPIDSGKPLSLRASDYKSMIRSGGVYRHDALTTLKADIHNSRSNERSRPDFDKFYQVLKKLRLKSAEEVIEFIQKKYTISEAKTDVVQGMFNHDIKIWINPTPQELYQLANRYRELRGLTARDDVFFWNASEGVHQDIGEGLVNANIIESEDDINWALYCGKADIVFPSEWRSEMFPVDRNGRELYQIGIDTYSLTNNVSLPKRLVQYIGQENSSRFLNESMWDYDPSLTYGFWITDQGEMLEVDVKRGYQHKQIAQEHFPHAAAAMSERKALDNGWIRLTGIGYHSGGNFALTILKPSRRALQVLARWVRRTSAPFDVILGGKMLSNLNSKNLIGTIQRNLAGRQGMSEATGKLRYTDTMHSQARSGKFQVIVEIDPEEFLMMTTRDDADIEQIKQRAAPLHRYNQGAKAGNDMEYRDRVNQIRGADKDSDDYLWGTIHYPQLYISVNARGVGKITGHEGRHRAAALIRKGGKRMRVAIRLFVDEALLPGVPFGLDYHTTAEHLPKWVWTQFRTDMVSTTNWSIIEPDMMQSIRDRN